ncbi:MAG: type III-A CRISPR-associated protein Cas10/Csm1 [Bacteroidia bacterium]|nr:MAG: type III-A CRISPR-associated protein Cas10/Csm1 [Bacteroidia bacterium]
MTEQLSNEKYKIYLAALLHDIGKFWQRADTYINGKWENLNKDQFKEEVFCPKYNNSYSHKHVLWTAQFVEEILGIKGEGEESLIRIAAKHHDPGSNLLCNIITKADHLSSGMDRSQLTEDQKNEDDIGNYKSTPIRSIFGTISRKDTDQVSLKYRLPVQILDINNIMPITEQFRPDEIEKLYKDTWEKFVTEIKNLKSKYDNNIYNKSFCDTLLYLFQKYCSYIPSSTHDLPDVSLYDHSKTTAAFAVCLWEYIKDKKKQSISEINNNINNNECPFLLLGADLSGIQKYIFNVISKNAAKNLKGRSFYLHLITTTIVKKILDKTNLFECNLIYNSGGGFYLILPNTENIKSIINEIEKEVQKELLEKTYGELSLAMQYVEFSMEEVMNKKINEIWERLFNKLEVKKQQKFLPLLKDENAYNLFFNVENNSNNNHHWRLSVNDVIEKGKSIEKDDITGKLITHPEKTDGLTVSHTSKEQIDLGKILKNADYWIITPSNENNGHVKFLGYSHYLFKKNSLDEYKACFNNSYTKVLLFNNTDFLNDITPPQNDVMGAVIGFEFYGGNTYPVDENGNPKSYDQLPKGELNKNAIIRMDVDNLGYLFQNGFKPEQRSFSRYSQLSRNLDLFFKGYLTHLWNSNNDYQNHTVILYAGGDDLFLLGDWEITINFAKKIRDDFRKYVCEHPLITLSGGIIIVPPKYPILKMAEWCDEMEKKGKKYKWKNEKVIFFDREGKPFNADKEKDAIGVFDFALSWDVEFSKIYELGEEIFNKIVNKELPKTFIQKIQHYYEQEIFTRNSLNEPISSNQIYNKRLFWLLAYDFARMMERNKNQKQFLEQILKDIFENKWKENQINTNYHSLILYALSARVAEFKVRNHKN